MDISPRALLKQCYELNEQVEQLHKQNTELSADAMRYRWLRERDVNAIQQGGIFVGITPDNVVINGKDLDIAIDGAMAP